MHQYRFLLLQTMQGYARHPLTCSLPSWCTGAGTSPITSSGGPAEGSLSLPPAKGGGPSASSAGVLEYQVAYLDLAGEMQQQQQGEGGEGGQRASPVDLLLKYGGVSNELLNFWLYCIDDFCSRLVFYNIPLYVHACT